ncbi:MAG: type I-U CRISPR-associated helicase/endonuclease Cas3 [Acidobacteriia bacterium]|nr:type I-U CRISPR-associated helicase/endonuclease Cas3 [Terriglobia bacterium]
MSSFRQYFRTISGFDPFFWQEELFHEFVSGEIPTRIDLPTGAGKTSVMTVWLLALAEQVRHGTVNLPRRIAWVVDRRVVVDQATVEAERLAANLDQKAELTELRDTLTGLCGPTGTSPLAVSTLRGEREDNRAWSKNPSRPAIVIGTVDMIGSRLLFSGYGDGRWSRGQHAGLLGMDVLIVNDEAHLTPAFAQLICTVSQRSGMRAILLSATQRERGVDPFPMNLDNDLVAPGSTFAKRFRAVKQLHIVDPVEKPEDTITELALRPDRRTIVFVRSPKDARKLGAAIEKQHKVRVPLITGVQRGKERDELLDDDVVKRFLSKDAPMPESPPCWLVATSAGEVGIDLSADRLITDLDTADHLLQRFGRLNRFGNSKGAAFLVYAEKQIQGEAGVRLKATVDYLRTLGGSVSPEVLRNQPPPQAAMSATPKLAPLLPWLIDVWSLTSIRAADWPSRPAVETWLRGEEASPPETYVAWRDETGDLTDPLHGVTEEEIEEMFDVFPVRAYERLKQYTGELCKALRDSRYGGTRAIVIGSDATVRTGTLEELLKEERAVRYGTLVLPPGVGYLDPNGMVDWTRDGSAASNYDVSEIQGDRKKSRNGTEPLGFRKRLTIELTQEDDSELVATWAYYSAQKGKKQEYGSLLLEIHLQQVADVAADLARRLNMNERVFRWAGEWHDRGKDRVVWQWAAGNPAGSPPVAKSERVEGWRLGGYRHEFGSLMDAESKLPADFSPEEGDLALHLIASHHGWARPHFEERAYDKDSVRRSRSVALECTQRLGRLQQRYGAWGLAYQEAVFRSADAIASSELPELPTNA